MKDISYFETAPAEEASPIVMIEEAVSESLNFSFEDVEQVEMGEESEAGCLSCS